MAEMWSFLIETVMVIPKVQQIIWRPEHYDAHHGNVITMLI